MDLDDKGMLGRGDKEKVKAPSSGSRWPTRRRSVLVVHLQHKVQPTSPNLAAYRRSWRRWTKPN